MGSEYATMDHAGWVERNTGQTLSALGKQVANIIGFAAGGIYNAPIAHKRQDWTDPYSIEINYSSDLSNWDRCNLSLLWIECMRRMVRLTISPSGPRTLKLLFHQRTTREGDISSRLPDVEEMVAMVDRMQGRIYSGTAAGETR